MEEAEDIVSSIFQTTRGIHSTMQTRREIDRLFKRTHPPVSDGGA